MFIINNLIILINCLPKLIVFLFAYCTIGCFVHFLHHFFSFFVRHPYNPRETCLMVLNNQLLFSQVLLIWLRYCPIVI